MFIAILTGAPAAEPIMWLDDSHRQIPQKQTALTWLRQNGAMMLSV